MAKRSASSPAQQHAQRRNWTIFRLSSALSVFEDRKTLMEFVPPEAEGMIDNVRKELVQLVRVVRERG